MDNWFIITEREMVQFWSQQDNAWYRGFCLLLLQFYYRIVTSYLYPTQYFNIPNSIELPVDHWKLTHGKHSLIKYSRIKTLSSLTTLRTLPPLIKPDRFPGRVGVGRTARSKLSAAAMRTIFLKKVGTGCWQLKNPRKPPRVLAPGKRKARISRDYGSHRLVTKERWYQIQVRILTAVLTVKFRASWRGGHNAYWGNYNLSLWHKYGLTSFMT